MSTRQRCWVSFAVATLATALVVVTLLRRPAEWVIIEEIDPVLLRGFNIVGFHPVERDSIREELVRKLGSRCGDAFKEAGLRTPAQMAWYRGVVIMPSRFVYLYEARHLGLTLEEIRIRNKSEFSTGRVQAITVPDSRFGRPLTTDGKPRIFIHDTAFMGDSLVDSFIFNRLALGDVITHELIHAGGQPPKPGWLGSLRHDLAGFKDYDKIMKACH